MEVGWSAPGQLGLRHAGVTILVVRDDQIASARLFMEEVDASGDHIDAAVRQLYRPQGSAPD